MEKQAEIKKGWIVCPVCGKKQFPLSGEETIINLRYRCRTSNGQHEHFMIVNFSRGKEAEK